MEKGEWKNKYFLVHMRNGQNLVCFKKVYYFNLMEKFNFYKL